MPADLAGLRLLGMLVSSGQKGSLLQKSKIRLLRAFR